MFHLRLLKLADSTHSWGNLSGSTERAGLASFALDGDLNIADYIKARRLVHHNP